MFTLNVKGTILSSDKTMVKLELVLFKTGFNRVPKVLGVTGKASEWDAENQIFKGKGAEAAVRNKLISSEKLKYAKLAGQWEEDGIDWTPQQLSHYFDAPKKSSKQSKQTKISTSSVSGTIDSIVESFQKKERFKGGEVITSNNNADLYRYVKNSLEKFTIDKYNRKFSSYPFSELDSEFINSYSVWLQVEGAKAGNKGGVCNKLKVLQSVFNKAIRKGVVEANLSAFEGVKDKMTKAASEPKTISYKTMCRIESADRKFLLDRQHFYLDMFLFSFYAGGMAPVDVCHLKWQNIQNDMIVYERIKCNRLAKPLMISKANEIINKYRGKAIGDYVFPVFDERHKTEKNKDNRVNSFRASVNDVLKNLKKRLKIKEDITWYSARGTYITKMIDSGYNAMMVAEQAGNSPDVISKHYYKTTDREEIIKNLNSIL